MSLDLQQFTDYILYPTLEVLKLQSLAATTLLLGTAVVESRLTFVKQIGGGPALGVYQMEPATHDDIWKNVLAYNSALRARVNHIFINASPEELIGNMFYATAMCRVHYYRFSEPLPNINPSDMARYHKKYYNTSAGATDITESTEVFAEVIAGGYV